MFEALVVITLAASKASPGEVAAPPPTPPPTVTAPAERPPPGAGSFGLRAGLGGSTATPGIDVGNIGAKFLVTDSIGLSVDIGLGLTAASGYSQASFAADAVVNFYFRDRRPGGSLRPYAPVLFGVGFASRSGYQTALQSSSSPYQTNNGGAFSVAFGGGIGAEYWFSPSFSLAAELMVRLSIMNLDPVAVSFGTLTPGIHATYWF